MIWPLFAHRKYEPVQTIRAETLQWPPRERQMDDDKDESMLDVLNGAVKGEKLRPSPTKEPPAGSINFMGQDDPSNGVRLELEQAKARIKQLETDVAYWKLEHQSAIRDGLKRLDAMIALMSKSMDLS